MLTFSTEKVSPGGKDSTFLINIKNCFVELQKANLVKNKKEGGEVDVTVSYAGERTHESTCSAKANEN